jgi:Leucine-rich repeat (LRR) protein
VRLYVADRCVRSQADSSNDNKVSYLTGMPDTVHTLYVARNRLTSLSSFDHLRRLEVLDLSGNMLESVSRESETSHD